MAKPMKLKHAWDFSGRWARFFSVTRQCGILSAIKLELYSRRFYKSMNKRWLSCTNYDPDSDSVYTDYRPSHLKGGYEPPEKDGL